MSSRQPGAGTPSSRRKGGPADGLNDLESGLEATVCAYLRTQPNFFERNPDLLAFLEIPHATGGAVSLIEHQIKVLRRQLETERGRLSHLITRAREYEALSNRLHALVLQIIPTRGLNGLSDALCETLTQELSAEAVALRLFPFDPDAAVADDPLLCAFHDFLDREHALCGPLEPDRSTLLFGAAGKQVKSAAVMPIRAEGRSGVLAIGAADPDRFGPEMGTDLLDRLAQIVSCKLVSLPAEDLAEIAPAQGSDEDLAGHPTDLVAEQPPEARPGV